MAAFTDLPGWRSIRLIITVNAAVFLAILVGRLAGAGSDAWFSLPASPLAVLKRPWTVLTYMVTQVEFLHLFFNMLWFWCFAIIAARIWPEIRLVLLYLAGGLGGAAAYIAVNLMTEGAGSLCGSSAAVLGIMSYTGVLAGNVRLQMLLLGSVRLRVLVIIAIVIALLGAGSSIGSLAAHAGGIATGALCALRAKMPAGIKKTITRRRGNKVAAALRRHREDHAELDSLLDKIRISGFDSLTSQERKRLEALSKRLDPQ